MTYQPITTGRRPSVSGIEYFDFEEDFMLADVRCIPMIVRQKLDEACVKLKLAEWNKFTAAERIEFARLPCSSAGEIAAYRHKLRAHVKGCTGQEPADLVYDANPLWANSQEVPQLVHEKLLNMGYRISLAQWRGLKDLERFALLKLSQSAHEHKNIPRALTEFKLV